MTRPIEPSSPATDRDTGGGAGGGVAAGDRAPDEGAAPLDAAPGGTSGPDASPASEPSVPDDVNALVAAGRHAEAAAALRAAGSPARAAALYEAIWELDLAAACAREAGDLAAAVRHLVDARRLDDALAAARELAATGADGARRAAGVLEARSLWGEAAALREAAGEPEAAAALYQRGGRLLEAARVLEQVGREREAGRLLERLVAGLGAADPAGAPARLALGRLLARLGHHEQATRHLQDAAREDGAPAREARRLLVRELHALGLADAAAAALRRARDDDPTLPLGLEDAVRTLADAAGGAPVERLGGRYRIERLLGAGASGRVWLARDEVTGRDVAVKVLHAPLGRGHPTWERFTREARVLGRVRHRHVVALLELRPDLGFVVLEHLPGGTLADRLRPRLVAPVVRRVALDVLAALDHAHAREVVHRDVKPSNVFFDAAGVAKLGDFGVAHLLDLGQTQTGALIGTLAYMAPEQITGAPLGAAADLYALGVTLFEALTGRLPFPGPDFVAAHLGDSPPRASDVAPDVPPGWDDLLSALLAKSPADRPASARDAAAAIERLAAGAPTVLVLPRARPDTPRADRPLPDVGAGARPRADAPPGAPGMDVGAGAAGVPADARRAGRYRDETPLGATATSTLSRAVDAVLGRSVIIERFAEPALAPNVATRVEALAAARTPWLQRVLAWDRAAGVVVYDAPVGAPLRARLAAAPLPPRGVIAILDHLGRALRALHAAGSAHGAVAAERVLVDDDDVTTLCAAGLGPLPPDASEADDVRHAAALAARALGGDDLFAALAAVGVPVAPRALTKPDDLSALAREAHRLLARARAPAAADGAGSSSSRS